MNVGKQPTMDSFANASLEAQIPSLSRLVLVSEGFAAAATTFLSRLASVLACERACLAFMAGRRVKIVAISQYYQRLQQTVLPDVAAAMDEAVLQGVSLVYPQPASAFPHITIAHAALARRDGMSRVLTVPIGKEGRLIGAITLEGRQGNVFSPEEVSLVEKLVADLGLVLELKWWTEQSLWTRAISNIRGNYGWRAGRWQRRRLVVVLALCVAALALIAVPIPNHVSGQARLEASIQRVISVPADGYLKEVHVRPGDPVKANQVLAELNDEALRAQQRQLQAEAAQYENGLADAMVKGDRAQSAVSRAKLDEITAQVELLNYQVTHTRLVAPFDGVVIKGDLSQLLGAPLKRGETLLTLSQGNEFKVIVDVDERDISDIRVDHRGTLMLAAFPDERFAIRVVRITPVAVVSGGSNTFEVEAVIESGASRLAPGLKGVAKIGTETRPAAWKWIARAWHVLTYTVWTLA